MSKGSGVEANVTQQSRQRVPQSRMLLGGTAAAVPLPFRHGDSALCGSHPLVTPYYRRLGDLLCFLLYTVSQKNCATFIFTVTLANVGRFLKFFQCRNQKEMAHNENEKFPTVA